jgi:hypothetical protein
LAPVSVTISSIVSPRLVAKKSGMRPRRRIARRG